MSISPDLLALLVCPVDHADLRLEGETLVCTECGRIYPIEGGIPNMLLADPPRELTDIRALTGKERRRTANESSSGESERPAAGGDRE